MNKHNIYISTAFVGGLLIGLVLGYAHECQTVKEILDNEPKKNNDISKKIENSHRGDPLINKESEDDRYEYYTRIVDGYGNVVKEGEDFPTDDDVDENDISDEEVDELLTPKNSKKLSNKIAIINPNLFGTDIRYEQKGLMIYNNGVLTTEDGEVIDDPKLWIGDCFDEFDFDNEDDFDNSCVYIRNNSLGCDLEVYVINNPYTEDI